MIPFLLTLVGIWLFFRLFGRRILAWLLVRIANKYAAAGQKQAQQNQRTSQHTQGNTANTSQTQPRAKQIVPDDVGEYVEYTEEVDSKKTDN